MTVSNAVSPSTLYAEAGNSSALYSPLPGQGALGLPPLPAATYSPVHVGTNAALRCPRQLENFFTHRTGPSLR